VAYGKVGFALLLQAFSCSIFSFGSPFSFGLAGALFGEKHNLHERHK
jgi:hypothetical protein